MFCGADDIGTIVAQWMDIISAFFDSRSEFLCSMRTTQHPFYFLSKKLKASRRHSIGRLVSSLSSQSERNHIQCEHQRTTIAKLLLFICHKKSYEHKGIKCALITLLLTILVFCFPSLTRSYIMGYSTNNIDSVLAKIFLCIICPICGILCFPCIDGNQQQQQQQNQQQQVVVVPMGGSGNGPQVIYPPQNSTTVSK